MPHPGPLSERALILAPSGRDGQIAQRILKEAGFPSEVCPNVAVLCEEICKGAGLAVIADEAIVHADLRPLSEFLEGQPSWSDFPIILLTQSGGALERNPVAARLADILGNVTFLERPFHPTTFTSVVGTALRGRRRQYEARTRLRQLREGEERLQTALDAGHLGSWTLEIAGMQLEASDTSRAHFGRRPDQPFTYDDFIGSLHPEDRSRMQDALAQTLRTSDDYATDNRTIWPDGSVHWVEVRARAIKDGHGAAVRLVGVSSDITERKISDLERERLLRELAAERAALAELTATLEQRVQERTSELIEEVAAREKAQEQLLQSQKVEALGQLTGGVAHDFNNLLMAVMGSLELLRKRLRDDARSLRLIDAAMKGAERGASLTQRMLAFARKQELITGSTDLVSLIAGMRDLLDRSLGPQIDLRLQLAERLPPALVDPNQVELAILNLAINARDAMPAGGMISIGVDAAEVGAQKALAPGTYLRIQVSDTGSGMDAATLKKAVEPFFSTKPVGRGTGLGLSMVHGLAAQLGGALELSSEVDKGTVATLWLPAAAAPAEAAKPAASAETKGRSATILVVDDDALISMNTVDMLEELGHTVIEAHSPKRALEILETDREVDLLLTDQAMPGMTGTELADVARRKRPGLPILLATGYADLPSGQSSDLPRLSKPYHQSELREKVNRLLESRS